MCPRARLLRRPATCALPARSRYRQAAFEAVLEGAAASLRQHGFRDIIFLGDHGGYQKNEQNVANKLNRAWGKAATAKDARAYALLDYYDITQSAYISELQKRGHSSAEIGLRAGLADAALMLATDPSLVPARPWRTDRGPVWLTACVAMPRGRRRTGPDRYQAAGGHLGGRHQAAAATYQ